jgi:hypothetical protein
VDRQEKSFDLIQHGLESVVGVFKLQFGVSTGAVALFVHAIFEKSEGPLLVGVLSVAAICFGVSAIMCLNALSDLTTVSTALAVFLSGAGEKDNEKENDKGNLEELRSRFKPLHKGHAVGNGFFYAGVICSLALLITKFLLELQPKHL